MVANEITQILNGMGLYTVPDSWYSHISAWDSWYRGDAGGFHTYRVYNGQTHVKCRRYSLGMAKKVCEDWAGLLLNEKAKITLAGEREQKFLDDVLRKNDFENRANELQEFGAALGTYAIIPRVSGLTVDARGPVTGGNIELDFLTADMIYPLRWKGREITECAFATEITRGDERFVYIQLHQIESGQYIIRNKMYHAAVNGGALHEVPITEVAGFEYVDEETKTGSDEPRYVIGRLNLANNIDRQNPMGISVYANAIDQLQTIDTIFDSYKNEFEIGKKRVMVKPSATKRIDGEPVFDSSDLIFYVLPEDVSDGTIIQPIDMPLRVGDHHQALQDCLNVFSAKCGLGSDFYKFEGGVAVTATEIIYNNQPLHQSVAKHKKLLKAILTQLARIILKMGNQYLKMNLDDETEIPIDLDDSVFVNREEELERMRMDVSAGLLRPEIYVAKKYEVSEDEALKMMPTMQTLTTESQNEVE